MTVVYAILQNYVTDFTCGCGYFTVFIYVEFIVCCVEIASAVYKERHNTVFICSTYGQVVLGVQCVGLNGVYINVFIQTYFICLLTILISFFYGNVTAVYYFRMLRRFCSCAICLIFDQFKLFFRCRSASRCKILTV